MILRKLQEYLPVPTTFILSEDTSIVDTPFYIMNYVKGRIFKDPLLPDLTPKERKEVYEEAMRVLAKLHDIDHSSLGLERFGSSGNYYERQISRWSGQYQKSKIKEDPEMDKIIEWLRRNVPHVQTTSIVHGDFRIDNLIFHPTEPKVVAILDWELSTIGHPYSDLAYFCMPYLLPPGLQSNSGFGDIDFKAHGIPTQSELLGIYCAFRNIQKINVFNFYQSFALFRAAAILQGVYKRSLEGNASSSNAKMVGAFYELLSKLAWKVASSSENKEDITMSIFPLSDEAKSTILKVKQFIETFIYPQESILLEQEISYGKEWKKLPLIEELKDKAKEQGLWNLFLPYPSKNGKGFTNLEYAFMCELMGRSILFAPEVFNCSAPDTGNMEVLEKYGSQDQKNEWLAPLLEGKIKSAFAMTEPGVASSDATNISCEIRREGEYYIITGSKWWTSGAMHPDCKVLIVMGKTSHDGPIHKQQSMILIPTSTPGVIIKRHLTVFGYDDAPHGHCEIRFENVKVPKSNIILGEGRGFEIAQGRLGPGRIHHCMRLIGLAERCLELAVERVWSRKAFKKPLALHGTVMEAIALSRIEIEQARLLTFKSAYSMDKFGNKISKDQIAMIKVVAPRMACKVIDRIIQLFGASGLSSDYPIARAYAIARTLRIADGPDDVHIQQVAKLEYLKYKSKL